jgi:hypothetical protein
VLAHAQSGHEIIQDFVALPASLDWLLGQEYLRQRGNKEFLSDASPVPYVVNNDGTLSRNAAEMFFTSLVAAEKEELGIGVGLFARYFLDTMGDLVRQHKKDFYERLTYIAADRSARMLHDVLKHGVLAGHPGRYRVRVVDAMEPETLLRDVMFCPVGAKTPSPPTPLPQGGEGSHGAAVGGNQNGACGHRPPGPPESAGVSVVN